MLAKQTRRSRERRVELSANLFKVELAYVTKGVYYVALMSVSHWRI